MHSYPYVNLSIFMHLNRKYIYIYTSLWPPMMFLFSAFQMLGGPAPCWAGHEPCLGGELRELLMNEGKWRRMIKLIRMIMSCLVISCDFMYRVVYHYPIRHDHRYQTCMLAASVHCLNQGHCGPVISHIFGLTKPGFFSSIPTCLAKSRARGQPPFHLAIDKTCFLRVYRLYRELYYPVLWGLS